MGVIEKPELLLKVDDSEITVEKYLTPEQQKQLEEERRLEEERLARERLDNWRERGLDKMMGGVLEIKKEDELKKDVPKPAFMTVRDVIALSSWRYHVVAVRCVFISLQQKEEENWTDEERKQFAEYERKVKELEEEREKYKKVRHTATSSHSASCFIGLYLKVIFRLLQLFCSNSRLNWRSCATRLRRALAASTKRCARSFIWRSRRRWWSTRRNSRSSDCASRCSSRRSSPTANTNSPSSSSTRGSSRSVSSPFHLTFVWPWGHVFLFWYCVAVEPPGAEWCAQESWSVPRPLRDAAGRGQGHRSRLPAQVPGYSWLPVGRAVQAVPTPTAVRPSSKQHLACVVFNYLKARFQFNYSFSLQRAARSRHWDSRLRSQLGQPVRRSTFDRPQAAQRCAQHGGGAGGARPRNQLPGRHQHRCVEPPVSVQACQGRERAAGAGARADDGRDAGVRAEATRGGREAVQRDRRHQRGDSAVREGRGAVH